MKKTHMFTADLLLLLVAMIWGGGFIAGKLALSSLHPMATLMYQLLLSSLSLGLIFFRTIKTAKRREAITGAILGTLFFSAVALQLIGLKYTSAAKQSFISAAYVVFTPLLSALLFREKAGKRDVVAAALVLFGVALISLTGDLTIESGDLISLGYTILFALFLIAVSRFAKDLSPVNVSFFQLSTAAAFAIVSVLLFRIPIRIEHRATLISVLYLSTVNTALATLLQNYAQPRTKEAHAAVLLSMESVFGFLFAVLIFHDPVTPRMLLGCGMVLAGVLLSKVGAKEI